MSDQVVWIETSKLQPHPKNPRLALRADVVDAIAAQVAESGFHPSHAVIARPQNGHFEILAGHHRTAGADKAGVKKVPVWVRELDDDAAYMLLVTSNAQGELSPLEIGLHALSAGVTKSGGGRGKKGGLSEYAVRLGKHKTTIGDWIKAAEVYEGGNCRDIPTVYAWTERTFQLAGIHKLPPPCWPSACRWLAANEPAVADVEKRVAEAVEFGALEGQAGPWSDYLPKHKCMSAIFAGTDSNNFNKLATLAAKVATDLAEHPDLAEQWRTWLIDNAGAESWDMRSVQAKRVELENVVWERENQEEPEAAAVSLVLADPPWQYDFAETDSRQIENQYPSATVEEICSHINSPWAPPLSEDCVLFLWATAPKLREALQVMDAWGFTYKTHAVWDKEKIGMGYWFRGQHELLLVGTKGEVSPPEQERRVSSLFRETRGKHSAKPECVYAALESMFPDVERAEFYQRTKRDGWIGCGNEAAK